MKPILSGILWLVAASLAVPSPCLGQAERFQKSADDIARELANPNATLGGLIFNFDQTWYDGELPDARDQRGTKLAFQPSLPYSVAEGVNVFLRPLVPVYFSQPVYGETGFEQKGFNLGDISTDAVLGKTWQSGLVTMVGVFASFPTATDDALSANQTILGPEAVVGYGGHWGFVGVLISQGWGLASDATQRASSMGGQYFLVLNLGKGWQFNSQPLFSYNWKASEGNRLTLPIPLGVKKTLTVGSTYVNLTLQYFYYAVAPDNFGPKHQIRFVVTPIVKLPW